MAKYIQSGYNYNYPKEIETWEPKKREEKIPEWITDRAKVLKIDQETGEPVLDTHSLVTGGVEIIGADQKVLVRTKLQDDLVCLDLEKQEIFSLSKEHLTLLYKKEEEK